MRTAALGALSVTALASLASGACGVSNAASPGATPIGYAIATSDGAPRVAHAGDAMRLVVVHTMSDGSILPLAPTASVVWSGPPGVVALAIGSDPAISILPPPAATPTAVWLENPDHFSAAQLDGVLWVLDPGTDPSATLAVTATLSDGGPPFTQTIAIPVGAAPLGDVARGGTTYGANCAICHGAIGQGSAVFPGLNTTAGNLAGDPTWNAALLGMTARSDMDNLGVSLDPAMPKWLLRPSATGNLLMTADFADIYAWLRTQPPATTREDSPLANP